MSVKKVILRKYMSFFSVNTISQTWAGYSIARNAKREEDKQAALLQISDNRYEESLKYRLDL